MTNRDEQKDAEHQIRVQEGQVLYTPEPSAVKSCNMAKYMRWLETQHGLAFGDYAELHQWSVRHVEDFWQSIVRYFDVTFEVGYESVLSSRQMPGARWFSGSALNYAAHALRCRDQRTAVIAIDETQARSELTYQELSDRVARARAGLERLGVTQGDRVAAFLPNGVEALVLFLACASLGAIWSSCAPEFGVRSVLDRFRQIEPKVLCTVDGYIYGGKRFDRTDAVVEIARELRSLKHVVLISRLGDRGLPLDNVISIDELLKDQKPLTFTPVPFEHPLWVLYSSGTTGLPKPIVQSHGGILLEHLKALSLHCDLTPDDRFFWFTTTGWMMWNFLIGGLLVGSTVVLYDGSPAFPNLSALWAMAAREGVTYFGTSAPYLTACSKARLTPHSQFDLSALRALGSTGAPLSTEGFAWVYEQVSSKLLLGSVSGGTDVCTAFVLSCPLLPVRAGEIQCAGLGCAVEAFDAEGKPLEQGEVGELVLTLPLPSMPIGFWGDADGSRYRDSYFSVFPGVWRHGDWIKFTESGGCVIYGRSDSTLNRGGVRMGTSEFYQLVESLPEVSDSLVVDTGTLDTAGKLWLFLVLAPGAQLDQEFKQKLKALLRTELSPRHVPDEIRQVSAIPRTLSGKKLEVPIKRIFNGEPPERALSRDTLSNPSSIDEFLMLAGQTQVEPPRT